MKFLYLISILFSLTACIEEESDNRQESNTNIIALIDSKEEPAGSNCPSGGTLIQVGIDNDNDGILDDDEITSKTYSCNTHSNNNEPPVIAAPTNIEMSYRAVTGVSIEVFDPESNPVAITWAIIDGPANGDMNISVVNDFKSVTLSASVVGNYIIQAQVYDGINLSTTDIDVVVNNLAPTYQSITLEPTSPKTGDNIYVNIDGIGDADGDNVLVTYFWSFDDSIQYTTTSRYLPRFSVPKGKTLEVYAEITDGYNSIITNTASIIVLNSAPAYSNISFNSVNVNTTNPIEAVIASLTDDDSDELTTSYIWTVNNDVVADITSSTLPAGIAVKDDVVSVVAIINDGETDTSTVEAILIVQDAPAIVVVSGLPANSNFGEALNFSVIVNDPDTGSVAPLLAFGPSGMTIDDSGEVSWTPDEIMFTAEEIFNFGFKTQDSATVISAHSITVRDASRILPIARSGVEVPKYNHSIWVDDYDGDNKNEILLTDSKNLIYTLEYDGSSYKQDWLYPFWFDDSKKIVQLLSDDVNGDGNPDIIVITQSNISIISNLAEPATIVFESPDSEIVAAAIENIDDDENLEIAVLYASKVEVYDLGNWSLEFENSLSGSAKSVLIGNVDNDSASEVIIDTGYVIDGATGINEWYLTGGFGSKIAVGDIDNNGVDEIIGTSGWANPKLYNAILKSELWEIVNDHICTLNIKNIDDDPQEEILVGNCQWGDVIAYDGSTGSAVQEYLWDTIEHASISVTAADPDGDGNIELIWGSGITSSGEDVLVIGEIAPSVSTYHNTNPSQLDYFTAAGWANISPESSKAIFLAPSTDSGYDGQRIIEIDIDGNMSIGDEISSNWDNAKYSKVVDYDLDGFDDIFMATAVTYNGEFQVRQLIDNTLEYGGNGGDYNDNIGVVESYLVNGDAYEDAIIANGSKVQVIDVFNQSIIWDSPSFTHSVRDVAAIKNGSDSAKIVVATGNELSIWKKIDDLYTREFTAPVGCERIQVQGSTNNIICLKYNSYSYANSSDIQIFSSTLNEIDTFSLEERITDFTVEKSEHGTDNLLVASYRGSAGYYDPLKTSWLSIVSMEGELVWRSKELLESIQHRSLFYLPDMVNGNKRVTFATADAMYISK